MGETSQGPPFEAMLARRDLLAAAVGAVAIAACSTRSGSAPRAALSSAVAPPPASGLSPPVPEPSEPAAAAAHFISAGPASLPGRVALTFHTNGDVALAHQLVDLLAARRTRVTAFVVGNWLEANPDWAARLRDAGHEVANHTYTHPSFLRLDQPTMVEEIVRCRDVITRLSGAGAQWFRPSGTDNGTDTPPATVLQSAGAAGYRIVVGYDVDPADYQDPGAGVVRQRVLGRCRPGSIVSLHTGHPGTIEALPAILDGLAAAGLQPVTLRDLLGPP